MLGPRSCYLLLLGVGLLASSHASDLTSKKWGYKETTVDQLGPEDWKLGFPNCGGTHQSPIDIPTHDISDMVFWDESHPPLRYGGECEKFTLKKLEDLYKWEIDPNEHCTVTSDNYNGREYSLLQFHMHSTSEHTKDGEHFDAELHFVHKAVDGSGMLLVMGVFVQAQEYADPNDFIEWLPKWKPFVHLRLAVHIDCNLLHLRSFPKSHITVHRSLVFESMGTEGIEFSKK